MLISGFFAGDVLASLGIILQAIVMHFLLNNDIYMNNVCSQDDVIILRINFTMHDLINVFWITKFFGITVTDPT